MRLEELILLAALGLAGYMFWKLHQTRAAAPAIAPPFAPPGTSVIPLGQYAVRPEAQWLVLQSGHVNG